MFAFQPLIANSRPTRLFLDTNILTDIIEDRAEFAEDGSAVLILAEQLGANLSIAWHGLATAYYKRSST